MSFAQGNSGRLNFINKWELSEIAKNAATEQSIKTINLAADKVFNYDYYAPPQRKFTILYNYIFETVSSSFLLKFYAVYLYEFYFKYRDLVIETVFKPMGFDEVRANAIYDDSLNGWASVDQFQNWVKLALKGQHEAVKTAEYESLVVDLKLSAK